MSSWWLPGSKGDASPCRRSAAASPVSVNVRLGDGTDPEIRTTRVPAAATSIVTTRRGRYAVELAVRSQFDGTFDLFGGLRRCNDIKYLMTVAAQLTSADAQSAIALATELIDAAEELRPHLGLFGSRKERSAELAAGGNAIGGTLAKAGGIYAG